MLLLDYYVYIMPFDVIEKYELKDGACGGNLLLIGSSGILM